MSTPISHVTDTALWVATYRAEESRRPDALFRDPLAEKLAGEKGREISRHVVGSPYTRFNVVMRTCVIDRFLAQEIANGVDLVLNLGAGLDSRPYRMHLPENLRWVEVDFPAMIDEKEKILAGEKPRCHLERRRVDLGDETARRTLLAELAGGARKIFVLTEGVVPYLSNEQVSALGRDLAAHPQFRFWLLDYMAPFVHKYLQRKKFKRQFQNAPFLFHPGEDWFGFFAHLGWKEKSVRYLVDESRQHGRPVPSPPLFRVLRLFMAKEKVQYFERFLAFVLLEPGKNTG